MFEGRFKLLLIAIMLLNLAGCSRSNHEAQDVAVEQSRAQQQQQAQAAPNQSPSPAASQQPNANAQSSPTNNQTTPQAAHVTRNYWTNFRGPNRDGRYDEMPVLTNWPAQGLQLVWKEPVGIGYASISIADDRAYTIEQRRGKEVVAAYDINTGHELWTQSWNAEFQDETGDGPR